MKYIVMIAAMVAVSMPCFARGRNSAQIYFPDAIRVGTTILSAGHYEIQWFGDSGPGAQVSFFRSTDADNITFEGKPVVTVYAITTSADNAKAGTSSEHPTFTETPLDGTYVLDEVEMPNLTLTFLGKPAH
jgi:hypothetical protein